MESLKRVLLKSVCKYGMPALIFGSFFYNGIDQINRAYMQYLDNYAKGNTQIVISAISSELEYCKNQRDITQITSDEFINARIKHIVKKEVKEFNQNPKKEHKLTEEMIFGIMQKESKCNPCARSKKGALGLMQIMPLTAKEMGVAHSFNLEENIHAGTFYFGKLLNRFNGDMALALAAYNAGPTLVARLGRVPANPETQDYVPNVMANIGHPPNQYASNQKQGKSYIEHMVMPDETYYSLGRRYNVTPKELEKYNGISPRNLKAGHTIKIPTSTGKG